MKCVGEELESLNCDCFRSGVKFVCRNVNRKRCRQRRKAVLPREHNTRPEDASTTLSDASGALCLLRPARFVWMMGCVLQDACDNMRAILYLPTQTTGRRTAAAVTTRRAGRLDFS